MIPWAVRYFRDQRGRLPVADFFELPGTVGITKVVVADPAAWVDIVF